MSSTAKTKAALLAGLAGLSFGFLAGMYLVPEQSHPESTSPQAGIDNSSGTAAAIRRLEAKVAELQEENSRLREQDAQPVAQVAHMTERPPEDEVARHESRERMLAGTTVRHETIRKQELFALRMQTASSAEQMTMIEAFMKDRDQLELALIRMMSDGGYSEVEIQKARDELEAVDLEAYLKQVLSNEQYAGYETFEKDKQHAQKESRAAQQLGDLSQVIPLTDEQKNKLYGNFYYDDPEKQNLNNYFNGGEFNTDGYIEAQTEVLREVLTREQMEIYEEQLRFEVKMRFGGR